MYLYLSMKYEFMNDFSLENENDLERRTKNFIVSNYIPFHGNKVYLVIDGKVVKSLDIGKVSKNIVPNHEYSVDGYLVHIRLEDSSICEILLREYLTSVLLSKYQEDIPDEVYKAIGILFSTYAYKCMKEDGFIDSNSSFAIYRPISYYKSNFANLQNILNRLNSCINDIDCLFLSYHDDFILPFIHYSNDGETLTHPNYPYLSSVKSLWDMASPYYVEINDISYEDISHKLGIPFHKNSNITITVENHIKKITLEKEIYTAEEFRNIFQLKSTNIFIIIHDDHLRIITKGWGNSYGLSVFGACEIAKNGGKYYHILKYYFPKTKLLKYTKELS